MSFSNQFLKIEGGRIFQCKNGFPIRSIADAEVLHIKVITGSYSRYPWLSFLFGISILGAMVWYFSSIEYSRLDERIESTPFIRSIGGLLVMVLFSGTIAVFSIFMTLKRVILMEFQSTALTFNVPVKPHELREIRTLVDTSKLEIDQKADRWLEQGPLRDES